MSASEGTSSNLGLMGGMFDPVHLGHISIAMSVLDKLELDAMHLLPCGNPVHRDTVFTSSEHRLAMLELAISGKKKFAIDSRECRSEEPSYTLNSLRAIKQERPGSRLFFILGQDAFNTFASWYHWREIFSQAHIVIAARPGSETLPGGPLLDEYNSRKVDSIAEMMEHDSGKILTTNFEMLDISSSQIRQALADNNIPEQLLDHAVADYIARNNLYSMETNA